MVVGGGLFAGVDCVIVVRDTAPVATIGDSCCTLWVIAMVDATRGESSEFVAYVPWLSVVILGPRLVGISFVFFGLLTGL